MPEEITVMNGGESPLAHKLGAAGSQTASGASESDSMQLNGGQAPTPGEGGSHSQERSDAQGSGDPPLGGVARSR